MDADTKLCCTWMVGDRGANAAAEFIKDLSSRLSNRIRLTTDDHNVYVNAVEQTFGSDIDYAMLIKIYGTDVPPADARYSSAEVISCRAVDISGKPDPKRVSTSHVERQNQTMRMHMRRFTRLTNAFSKTLEHHFAAISLHFAYDNCVRIHQTLRVTPAMAAGVSDRVWEVADIVALLEQRHDAKMEQSKEQRVWKLSCEGTTFSKTRKPISRRRGALSETGPRRRDGYIKASIVSAQAIGKRFN